MCFINWIRINSNTILMCLFFASGSLLAKDTIDCTLANENSVQSACHYSVLEGHQQKDTVKIIRRIDLQPVTKSFRKYFSKQINLKTCEKKVFIKRASLDINDNSLLLTFMARINRQYCTRRAKQQVYEKTNSVSYTLTPVIAESGLRFKVQAKSSNKASYEKSLADVLSSKIDTKINRALLNILNTNVENLNLPFQLTSPIVYDTVRLENNSLLIEMLATPKASQARN